MAPAAGTRGLASILRPEGIDCVDAWRHTALTDSLFRSLMERSTRYVRSMAPYLRVHEVEDLVADMMCFVTEKLDEISSRVKQSLPVDEQEYARILGGSPAT